MKLYIMRHGQTDWNAQGRVQGRTDIELNETGIEQAKNARGEFAKYNIDLIISSPLKRARKTAEIVSEKKKVPIIIDERIVERCFGDKEGSYPAKEKELLIKDFWNYNENVECKNIEPVAQVCARVWELLDEVKEKYNDKNVLLVTHGGTSRAINAYFAGFDEEGVLSRIGIQNCEIREYDYQK